MCSPGIGLRPRTLTDAQLARRRIAIDVLGQPENRVGDGEHRVALLLVRVFADQERRDFPRRELLREPIDEARQLDGAVRRSADRRSPTIVRNESTATNAGAALADFGDDATRDTASRSPPAASAARLMNRTADGTRAGSKKSNCRW